jgi:hypothetical protein
MRKFHHGSVRSCKSGTESEEAYSEEEKPEIPTDKQTARPILSQCNTEQACELGWGFNKYLVLVSNREEKKKLELRHELHSHDGMNPNPQRRSAL